MNFTMIGFKKFVPKLFSKASVYFGPKSRSEKVMGETQGGQQLVRPDRIGNENCQARTSFPRCCSISSNLMARRKLTPRLDLSKCALARVANRVCLVVAHRGKMAKYIMDELSRALGNFCICFLQNTHSLLSQRMQLNFLPLERNSHFMEAADYLRELDHQTSSV